MNEGYAIRERGYKVQRRLGDRFRGRVLLDDGSTATVSFGFSNAGFRGIEFWDGETGKHYNAGRIVEVV